MALAPANVSSAGQDHSSSFSVSHNENNGLLNVNVLIGGRGVSGEARRRARAGRGNVVAVGVSVYGAVPVARSIGVSRPRKRNRLMSRRPLVSEDFEAKRVFLSL